jgi:hypothetical protein
MRLEKQVTTHRMLELICNGVWNKFHVKLFGIAQSHVDTDFIYDIQTDDKVSKAKMRDISIFIEGLEAGFLASGI